MIAIDTNLLIYAHRAATPEHQSAIRAIESAAAGESGWGFSLANVLEFWSVVTHPASPGRPSAPEEAGGFIRNLIEAGAVLWAPSPGFAMRLLDAAMELAPNGPRIFDLQIALTAVENGAREIWTHDRGFLAVPGLTVRDPLASR